jgi:hypothetical protein
MIRALAVLAAVFKRCCLTNGKHDGANRDYFFQRVERLDVDFRFLFAIIAFGRGNGKRLAAPLPLGSPGPPAV